MRALLILTDALAPIRRDWELGHPQLPAPQLPASQLPGTSLPIEGGPL